MNKIGMHVHRLTSEVYAAIQRLQPSVVIVMDPTPQWIRDIRAAAPNCYLGVRKYEEGVHFADRDPAGWADEIAAMCGDAIDLVDGAITYNEPLPQGHDDHAIFPVFDAWQATIISRLQDVHGIEALAFPLGTGQFTSAPDRVNVAEAFPLSCAVCRTIAPHDYGWPNMWKDAGWHSMRWLTWLSDMEAAGYGRKKVVVSECGLTQGVVGGDDVGWHTLHDNLQIAADLYLESLDWYNQWLVNVEDCIGCATYDWAGSDFGWATFEHVIPYVIDGIEKISAEPENGGQEMEIEVLDRDYQPKTLAWAKAEYGIDFTQPQVAEGELAYFLVGLYEKTGESSHITKVVDAQGNPLEGEDVTFYWPSSPDPPDPPTELYPTDHRQNFTHGLTNENGDIGPGMGTGAYISKGECGPHEVWVRHPTTFSVHVKCIGMLGSTNHDHLNLKIQLRPAEGEPLPPNGDVSAQIITRAEEIIQLASTGQVSQIKEVHLVTEDGEKSVFVPKIGGLLARILGK